MFSNDNNVETIAQLIEAVKHYVGLQKEYIKLDVIEKVVRLLTAMALIGIFVGLLTLSLIYVSFSAAHALQTVVGSLVWGYLIVGGAYFALLLLFIVFRHRLIERPLVRFLASLLMSK
ncbi:MAG: phage holin family protein [Prevotella sp.]|nr:phage holin family protein [Prevotellaceae bacterium]MDY3935499.1 phage holin family protein [Prevotella sp.]